MYQQALAGIGHISFTEEVSISPKRPATLPEVAKQRELSGTLESEDELKLKKQISDAKSKELSGHDIFAPPPEILPRPWLEMHRMIMTWGSLCPPICARLSKFPILLEDRPVYYRKMNWSQKSQRRFMARSSPSCLPMTSSRAL